MKIKPLRINFKSVKTRFIFLLFICWCIPMVLILAFNIYFYVSIMGERTGKILSADMDSTVRLSMSALDQLIADSKAAVYDGVILENYLNITKNPVAPEPYNEIRNYMRTKYGYSNNENFAIVSFPNMPGVYCYASREGSIVAEYMYYMQNVNQLVLEKAAELDSGIGFVEQGGDLYAVRNLINPNTYETYGILALRVSQNSVFAPMLQDGLSVLEMHMRIDGQNITLRGEPEKIQITATPNLPPSYAYDFAGDLIVTGCRQAEDYTFEYQAVIARQELLRQFATYGVFVSVVLGASVGITFLILYMFYSNISAMHDEEIALKDAKIRALQVNINPHFLNNTLEIMNWQARMDGAEEVSKMIEALSRVLDAGLDRSGRRFLPLREELAIVDSYLYIALCRFGDNLQIIRRIDEPLLDIEVPGLILQPIIENAIEHGIAPNLRGTIEIEIYKQENCLNIDIINDASLSDEDLEKIQVLLGDNADESEHSTHIGVNNVNKRLHLIYGENSGLSIKMLDDGRTISKIQIYMKKEQSR